MADRGRASRSRKDNVSGRFEFVGLEDEQPPRLRMEAVSPTGERKEIRLSDSGEFSLDPKLAGRGFTLELRSAEGEASRRYSYDSFVDQVSQQGLYRLPESVWGRLHLFDQCVTGSVTVCRFRPPFVLEELIGPQLKALSFSIFDPIDELIPHFPPPWWRCDPVCQGKVEVFIRTCCCPPIGPLDPPIVIKDICEIIDCGPIIEPDFPPKGPGPGPGPGPDPGPEHQLAAIRALKRSAAQEGGPDPQRILRLSRHLDTLKRLPLREQIAYIELYPELRYRCCTCSTEKVSESYLQPDGHFEACWLEPFYLLRGCTRRVMYRVSQIQESGWVVVYDGLARNESFALDEEPDLRASWYADPCDGPHTYGPVPFALLESIGGTWGDALIHSTQQNGEKSFTGPLLATDGLVNEAPVGPIPVTAGPYEQPGGQTLPLHYQFHHGLAGLGAKYFRTRVVRVTGNGNPMGGPNDEFPITGGLAWRKYYDKGGGQVGVQWVELSNPAIGGVVGLYTIPFPDLVWPWLDGQYHAYVQTAELLAGVPRMPNGRYVFVLDLFDAGGTRLIPAGSGAPGPGESSKNFEYRRLDGPIDAPFSNTSVVLFKALGNLFLVDNLACYGDIEQIMQNSTPSSANCQFLVGPGTDLLKLRYSAYQTNGYQWYHQVSFKQGLSGPVTSVPPSNANVFSGDTPGISFSALLGSETKCAFSGNLSVYAKHTNGSGRIQAYDQYDVAAFALEIGP
jgi:hypothetical protein